MTFNRAGHASKFQRAQLTHLSELADDGGSKLQIFAAIFYLHLSFFWDAKNCDIRATALNVQLVSSFVCHVLALVAPCVVVSLQDMKD